MSSSESMQRSREELPTPRKAWYSLMRSYNALLEAKQGLEARLDEASVAIGEREKLIPGFKVILERLNSLIMRIEEAGYVMSSNEVCNGFKAEGRLGETSVNQQGKPTNKENDNE